MSVLTDLGNNLQNLWNQGTSAVGNEIHNLPQQVQTVAQNFTKPNTTPGIGNSQPINWQQAPQQITQAVGNFNPIKTVVNMNPNGQTALDFAKQHFNYQPPDFNQMRQNLLNQGQQSANAYTAEMKKMNGQSLTPQDQQAINTDAQNKVMAVANIGGGTPDIAKGAFYLRSKLDPEAANVLKDFATFVETKGSKVAIPGDVGQTTQAIMKDAFGVDAANWSNQKMKNVIDLVLGKIGGMKNNAGLGLAVGDIRQGEPVGGVNEPVGNPEPLPWEKAGLPPQTEPIMPQGTATKEPLQAPQAGQEAPVPNMNDVGKQVRLAHFAESQKITAAAEPLANQANAVLKGEDNNLFRQAMQHPEQLDQLSNQASNPQAFKQLATSVGQFFDKAASITKDNKVKMGFVENYFPQIWDLSTPEAKQTFNNLMSTSNFKSGFSKGRLFQTIEEGQKAGLVLKNPNVSQDIVQYARSMGMQTGQQAAFNKANELVPNSMVNMKETSGMPPRDYAGKPYKQSPIPGQDATFVAPDLAKKLNYYNPSAFQDNPIVKVLDKVNTGLKETKLAGGLFHAYRESVNFIGASIGRGQVPRLDEAGRAFVDPGFWNSKMTDFVKRGVVDDASNMGITLSKVQDIGKYGDTTMNKIGSMNPLEMLKSATFGRLINYYKLKLIDGLPQQYRTPEVGTQIEALFNGINNEVAGTNKSMSQLGRFAFLAAPFNLGKMVNVGKAAFTPSLTNPAANFARTSIIGTVITTAVGTEILRKLISGNFSPDIKSLISNSILNPNVSLPYKSPSGQPLQMGVPGTDVSDVAGAIQDPSHFITARAGPALSLANQVASGQDYYGNQLVNPFGDQGLGDHLKAAGNLALAQAPIPVVQAAKVIQGKESPTTAALNTLGMRVHTDPNSPTNQYFNGLNQAANTLNPNDKQIFLGQLHPQTKDPDGNPVIDKTPLTSPAKFETLLSNPKLLAAEVAFEKSQPSHDPLWDLTPAQLKSYMQAQVISKNNPTSYLGTNDKTVSTLYSTIPQSFFTARTAYFNNLQSQGVSLASSTPTAPQMPADISAWFTAHNALGSSKAKAADWNTPEGQKASAFMQQGANFTNQQRADMGLPLITGTGSAAYSPYTKKVTIGKAPTVKAPTIKPFKISLKSVSALKKTAAKVKIPKTSIVKMATTTKATGTKAPAKFKVTAPRVWLSTGGSSMRGVRKQAGISIPVRKRKLPHLTV